MEYVHSVVENLSRPAVFPKRELVIAVVGSPLTWQLCKSRMVAHAGELVKGPSVKHDWKGVFVFLAGETGQILMQYGVRLCVSRTVAAGQSIDEDESNHENRAQMADRAAKVARAGGVALIVLMCSAMLRLVYRAQLRRAVLGPQASSRLFVSPSIYGWFASSFLAVFPFAPLTFLSDPVKLFVANLFAQAEVRMSLDEELGVLNSLEDAVDHSWGALIAGLPHAAALAVLKKVNLY